MKEEQVEKNELNKQYEAKNGTPKEVNMNPLSYYFQIINIRDYVNYYQKQVRYASVVGGCQFSAQELNPRSNEIIYVCPTKDYLVHVRVNNFKPCSERMERDGRREVRISGNGAKSISHF